jgi:acrylyl-CoA reductase (NADPH)
MGFLACRVFEQGSGVAGRLVRMQAGELTPGSVLIRARYSGVNYKDALAVSGRGRILKRLPLNAGIDVCGVVAESEDERYAPGDSVLVNGMGLGETQDGGLAELVRVPADWIVPLPAGLTPIEAMTLGTAGFTAALALERMELNGQRPEQGPILISGASGGVGSIAVSLLASRGYSVIAVSGRTQHHAYLRRLGAAEVKTPAELALGGRPLESARYAGAIDSVGGELLEGVIRHVGLWGQVASVGNAAGAELRTSVFPLILRGVSLLGISSANCPMPLRTELWRRLGGDLKPPHLAEIASAVVALADVMPVFGDLLERGRHGRVVVDCAGGAA